MAHAFVQDGRQPSVAGRPDNDRAGLHGVGVLGNHPAGRAVIRGVQQDLPLGCDVVAGELVEVAADQRLSGRQALAVDGDIARHCRLRGVHDVHGQSVLRGQAGCRLDHSAGGRSVVDGGQDDAAGLVASAPVAPACA